MTEFRVWCVNKGEWEDHECFLTESGSLIHSSMRLREGSHIVEFKTGAYSDGGKYALWCGDLVEDRGDTGVIIWDDSNYCYAIRWATGFVDPLNICLTEMFYHKGNIHENPENFKVDM